MPKTILIALTQEGAELAKKIRPQVDNAEIHGLAHRVDNRLADICFDNTIAHIQAIYAMGHTLVGICASAILVRALAPVLGDKRNEPPVLAIGQDGVSIVPLLGGHRGANALAQDLAVTLGAHAAITTAGDLSMGFSLDQPPAGYHLENPELVKDVTAALLAGDAVKLIHNAGDGSWPPARHFSTKNGNLSVLVTDRADCADGQTLVIHPPSLMLGVGCERNAPAEPLIEFVRAHLSRNGLSPSSVCAIGSIDLKADETALRELARNFNRPFRIFSAGQLAREQDRLQNPSDVVFAETGCYGVSEGAALALSGKDAKLILPKVKDLKHTLAIARCEKNMGKLPGRAPGKLYLVGTGPGTQAWRTKEAVDALQQADEIVGYQLYLDLVADLIGGKPVHRSELGEEEARTCRAIELAAEGKTVALVCSGDPGIYALATLAYELIERNDRRDWNGVEIITCPGISAFQAAAARLGAPVNHDFCTISLSDLLTPQGTILNRLKAAGEGDFVIAFYNPQSRRRRRLLGEARDILRAYRPADTPVAIARNLGRADENIAITTLAAFIPDSVDMLSLVIVGNSETRTVTRAGRKFIYTPRGYAKKMDTVK